MSEPAPKTRLSDYRSADAIAASATPATLTVWLRDGDKHRWLRSLYIKLGANEVATLRLGSPEVLNVRARAVSIALQRGLINSFELAREEQLLTVWLGKQ